MLASKEGEMNRYVVCVLALMLMASAACAAPPRTSLATGTPFSLAVAEVSPTPTATPQYTPLTPEPSGLRGDEMEMSDPSQADQAVREAIDWLREASGLRAELGPQADEIFRLVDQAQAALVEDMMAQWPAGAKPKGMPAPLPPLRSAPPHVSVQTSLAQISVLLVTAPLQVSASQTGDAGPQVQEFDEKLGDHATAHLKRQMQVAGSKLEMSLEMTMRAEKDGTVYEERVKGKISLNICPDDKGMVPLDLTLQSSGGSGDNGFEINMAMHAIGYVDDDANMAGYDQDGQTEMSVRSGRNVFGGVNTDHGQVHLGWSISGLNTPGTKGVSFTPREEGYSLSYLFAKPEVKERIRKLAIDFSMLNVGLAFKSAEIKWQDGFCVAVHVAEGKTQQVLAGSETPFTATVRHQFEGSELTAPVIATLKSGAVSVSPSGEKVPAAATFRYKAPAKAGERANVELVSRSRRGIGKLNVSFRIEKNYYTVEAPWGDDLIRVQGTICSFDGPFTLILDGHKPGGNFPYTGKVEFTPADATSGNWLWTGQYTMPYLPPTSDKGGSTYQVTGLLEGNPMIVLSPFTQTGSQPGIFHATHHWPAYQIPLVPETGTCSNNSTGE